MASSSSGPGSGLNSSGDPSCTTDILWLGRFITRTRSSFVLLETAMIWLLRLVEIGTRLRAQMTLRNEWVRGKSLKERSWMVSTIGQVAATDNTKFVKKHTSILYCLSKPGRT